MHQDSEEKRVSELWANTHVHPIILEGVQDVDVFYDEIAKEFNLSVGRISAIFEIIKRIGPQIKAASDEKVRELVFPFIGSRPKPTFTTNYVEQDLAKLPEGAEPICHDDGTLTGTGLVVFKRVIARIK